MKIKCIVSVGEFIDKLSILSIKKLYISDKKKLLEIEKEIHELKKIYPRKLPLKDPLFTKLQKINLLLWKNMENRKKIVSNNEINNKNLWKIFKEESILNDKRYIVKKNINNEYHSDLKEQKSYPWL